MPQELLAQELREAKSEVAALHQYLGDGAGVGNEEIEKLRREVTLAIASLERERERERGQGLVWLGFSRDGWCS